MNVYVCKIVPSLQQDVHAKIEDYNNHLAKWGETNRISVIDPVPTFKLGTGDLNDLCFDKKTDSYSTLNILGAIKLLNTIDRHELGHKLGRSEKKYKHLPWALV